MSKPGRKMRARGGFTLIEMLAAIAIGSVIIAATAGLTYNVAFHFDRGTRAVGHAEQIVLAVDRLSADFGSARYVRFDTNRGIVAGFSGTSSRIVFISASRVVSRSTFDDVIDFKIENGDKVSRIMRRRASWLGPRMSLEKIDFVDPVVLLEGPYDISVAYGFFQDESKVTWVERWDGEPTLPRYIRLNVRDRLSKQDVLEEMTFAIRADAPSSCAASDSKPTCLSGVPIADNQPADARQPAGTTPPGGPLTGRP